MKRIVFIATEMDVSQHAVLESDDEYKNASGEFVEQWISPAACFGVEF